MDGRVKEVLIQRVGFHPNNAIGWLYAARGLFKLKEYHLCIEALSNCLRNEHTLKEAQHLLAFSLLNNGQIAEAASAFTKSVKIGNKTDWQPLIELYCDHEVEELHERKD